MGFIFVWLTLFVQSSLAFKITLLDSTLDLGTGMNSTTATVINDSENMIAIEASARLRLTSEDGVESFAEVPADDLIIVPNQMIIPPNSEQVLNVRWVGKPEIPAEQAYRLLVEYVSISQDKLKGLDPEEQKAGVVIQYRIAKSFYVVPKGAKANVQFKGVQTKSIDGKPFLVFSFENTGSKHHVVGPFTVQFNPTSENPITVPITTEMLDKPFNVLATQTRTVTVPLPEVLNGVSIENAGFVSFDDWSQ